MRDIHFSDHQRTFQCREKLVVAEKWKNKQLFHFPMNKVFFTERCTHRVEQAHTIKKCWIGNLCRFKKSCTPPYLKMLMKLVASSAGSAAILDWSKFRSIFLELSKLVVDPPSLQ
jgi:hypothetical protein